MDIALIIFWSVFIVVTIILELETAALITVWFTIGAIGALIAAAFEADPLLQIGIFLGISLVLLLLTRPLTKNMMKKEIVRTNSDRVIGMTAVITKDILQDEVGEARVQNVLWRAANLNGLTFVVGEKVRVEAITGTRLIVSKIEDDNNVVL